MLKGVAPALPTHRSGRSWRLVTRSAGVSFLRLSCGSVWPLIAAAVGLLLVISGNARGETNDHMYAPQAAAAPYINFDNEGYIINGQRTWVASGDIHYPRVPEELWLDRLLRLKRCGLNTVQTYAFMNYHCMGSGTYNFTGQADLNQYLQDINSLGLYALVRAGMYVCSEWDNGGYPQFMMLEPGLSLRTSNTPQYLAVSDQWYAQVIPIIAANQINKGGAVLWVQLDNEHPSCWGVDYDNLTYFQHLLSMALADGIQVPMYFSGLHHSSDPAGTSSWNSVGREDPWFADEFWAGWFSYYGNSGGDLTTVDRGTWKIIAYGGNGYDYYMFHGGSNWDHWPAGGIGASYDYGAAVGEAGDLRTMYYRDKRAAIFAHSFQSILEQSTNADASYAGAATGTTAINARTSPAGTIVFLDNDTANTVTATLADGAQMQLEAYEIGNVVENFALAPWIMIDECDERIFGIQPQGAYTTLVLYGLPGDIAQSHFGLTSGTVSQADPEFTVSGTNVSFSAPVAAGTTASYQLTSGTNTLRVLVMSKPVVDRTWFVSSSGSNYVVNGPDYVGNFTNPNGQVNCTLEEPLGNPLPTTILSYGPDQYAPHPLTISSPVANGTPAAPTLTNWQMRSGTGEAAVGYNDSAWYTTATPQLMGSDGDTSNYAWYRAEPVIATSGTYYLATPAIYDSGQLYVNGTLAPVQPSVSGTCVPIALQSGTNTVAFFTAHYGRESFYEVTGTSASGFSPKGLQGGVGIGATPLTNWYWWNTGTNAVPTSGTLAAVTATTFNPAANGWSTGAGWNKNVLTGAGYAFFRTTLPNLPGPQTVYFTNVADNCTVYLNGTNVVGSNNGAATPFTVSLSSYWSTSGTNVLTVLVRDVGAADGSAECGLNGGVLMNPLSTAIPNWKLQGGLGTIEGPNVTWGAVGTTGSTPTFYHATFNYQPSSGILPILRAGYAGLTSGHIWLNGHPLGRYPQVIPITGIYLPECWLSAANTIDYFDENGAAPTSTSLFVETGASREVYQAQDIDGAMIYPPETFSAAGGNGEVTLSWSAVAGATGYNVKRSTTSGGPYTTIGSNVSALTFLDSGVNNGITYYYVVSGTNASGETAPSAEESATPAYIVPTVANPSFELPGTGKISSGFSTVPGWANAGSTYANSGVENSPASYAGSWHAFCKGSDSGAYQMLGYQMQAGDSITLTWWAEHTGGSGASGQIVSLLSGASQTAPYSSTTILSTTNGALNGYGSTSGPWTQYTLTYTAAAADAGNYIGIFFNNNSTSNWSGFDDFSISVASLPYPPTGLTALDQTTSVALNWYPVVTAASYNLKRGIVSGTYNTTVAVSGTNYTDSGVTQGTTYYYAVSGVNNVGEGSNSIPVSVTPSPPISIAEQMYSNAFIPPGTSGSNGTVVFRSSVTGHTYTLQWSPDISKGVWTAIGNPMTGTGGNLEFPPVSLTGTMGFYRILIQRQ